MPASGEHNNTQFQMIIYSGPTAVVSFTGVWSLEREGVKKFSLLQFDSLTVLLTYESRCVHITNTMAAAIALSLNSHVLRT